jgi:hypothetical protein
MDLVEANLLGSEQVRRLAEVTGELPDKEEIGLDRARGVVAHREVLEHPLT